LTYTNIKKFPWYKPLNFEKKYIKALQNAVQKKDMAMGQASMN